MTWTRQDAIDAAADAGDLCRDVRLQLVEDRAIRGLIEPLATKLAVLREYVEANEPPGDGKLHELCEQIREGADAR